MVDDNLHSNFNLASGKISIVKHNLIQPNLETIIAFGC